MIRKVLKDWTLSDGTLLPAGTFVGVAADAMNKANVRSCSVLLLNHSSSLLPLRLGNVRGCAHIQRF